MVVHCVKKFLLTRVIRDIQKRVECVDRETVAVGFSQEERYSGSSVTMFAISMALERHRRGCVLHEGSLWISRRKEENSRLSNE